MDITSLKDAETIYFLDRNAWDVNDPNALIVEMEVIEENGKLIAYADQGHETLQFELTEDLVTQIARDERKYLFMTRKDAREHYNQELKGQIQSIHNLPKEDLAQQFFDRWREETNRDKKVIDAMRAKIKTEFGVDI
ncbi:hypothetical protein HXA34_20270 [Salipaludibacillus agaradhaerens]|jgi:hypothetical protein|uniref:hypothetical protein n=1 Tax=Salipaludibacillus agaradhaerens TaxID=76935 RepID=UPI002151CF84|nr:hypothetical protein [Salipaludibacillus agaradhaerens]MCR6108631.1 hypothetical protein [Salipaludibacillus agaradhaerens]MCR6120657.1 hypothetical protein [Salipaludibacillus agaradhaerens]